VEFRFYFR